MTFTPLFELGTVVATPGALDVLRAANVTPTALLRKHLVLEPGCLSKHDIDENHFSLKEGFRLWSAYMVGDSRVEVITEADRSVTTLLLMEEY